MRFEKTDKLPGNGIICFRCMHRLWGDEVTTPFPCDVVRYECIKKRVQAKGGGKIFAHAIGPEIGIKGSKEFCTEFKQLK